jgi:hypothetical protein
MREFKVTVSPEAEEFYLAFGKGWAKQMGHLIEVEQLKFSAVPVNDIILVSEVESGAIFFHIPVPEAIQSYDETMLFLELNVAVKIVMIIERVGIDKVESDINLFKESVYKKLGKKPTAQKVNIEWFKSDISDVLH